MTTGRFIWPPAGRREGGDPGAGDAARAGAAAREAVRGERGAARGGAQVWSAVERTWIGVVSSPLEARLREAGLSVTGVLEGSDASCWRCGHDVGPHEVDGAGCARCRGMRLNWQAAVRVGPYRSGPIGGASDASEEAGQPWGTPAAVRVGAVLAGAIREVKYGRFAALGEDLGRRLGVACRRRLIDVGMEGAMVVVVPVPTSWKRRLLRGIDHPRVIARGVAQELDCVMWSGLSRSERPSQTLLAASERGESVRGTMRLGWRA
nr:hypothetical protein [Phycisphaerales bacterium]